MLQALYPHWIAARLAARLKRARLGSNADAAAQADIADLVERQIGRWSEAGFRRGRMLEKCREWNRASRSVFVFEAGARRFAVWAKPEVPLSLGFERAQRAQNRDYRARSRLYREFIEAALASARIERDFVFAVDMDDHGAQDAEVPIFGFQKHSDASSLLLPDIDFLKWSFYDSSVDGRRYEDKTIAACFVGSSSGGWIDERTVAEHALPRLRAAHHFVGHPDVVFRIAAAVQCTTRDARRMLRRQPYFAGRMQWSEQFGYRFLLSMDGNGAACSRLAIALKSHSVPVKYDSPHQLFYFPAMVAGRDYLAVGEERDVEALLEEEKRSPGRFAPVAAAGSLFFRRYLNAASLLDYTAAIFSRYARLYSAAAD